MIDIKFNSLNLSFKSLNLVHEKKNTIDRKESHLKVINNKKIDLQFILTIL